MVAGEGRDFLGVDCPCEWIVTDSKSFGSGNTNPHLAAGEAVRPKDRFTERLACTTITGDGASSEVRPEPCSSPAIYLLRVVQ